MDHGEVGLPPGFRFHPTDEELVGYYLAEKVADSNFTGKAIAEVDLNKCEPWDLPEKAKMGEKEWYFFCMRDRKYPTGLRTNRATEAGYWKATGKDREVFSTSTGKLVGMKKTLVFYKGRAPKGGKTNWVMHEYRLEGNVPYHHLLRNASMEDWVVCRIFKKSGGAAGGGGGSAAGKKINATSEMISRNKMCNVGDMGSPSLPPLLESPPTAFYEFETREHLEIGESAGCGPGREHVSCFSTDIYKNYNNHNPNFRPVSYVHHRGGNILTPSESAELSDIVNIVKSSSSPAYLHTLMLGDQCFHPNIPSCTSSFGQGVESPPPPPMPHYSQLLSLPYSTAGPGNMPSDAILKSLLDQYNADIAGEATSGSMQCKIEPTTIPSPSFGSLSAKSCNSNNILGNLRINDGAQNATEMASDGRNPATEPVDFDCAWP